MKSRLKNLKLLITLVLFNLVAITSLTTYAQENTHEQINQALFLKELSQKITENYIYRDKAEEVRKLLNSESLKTSLSKAPDQEAFISQLKSAIQTILSDKHFNLVIRRPRGNEEPVGVFDAHLNALTNFRKGGFQDIKMLEGNVGYVKIDGFRGEEKHQVDGLMTYLRTADAIILDLRKNGGGGSPVEYLSSYFLEEGTLIERIYHRKNNTWRDSVAKPVKGDRRLHVPLFILTGSYTFSAAEAFTYDLQAQKRAIVVGEVTGGGAHPTSTFRLANGVIARIPNRRSYNPVTQSNWEGTGIKPDYKVDEEQALEKAHQLAKVAAKEYRESLFVQLKDLLKASTINDDLQQQVNETVKEILHRKHMEKFMVSGFARRYMERGAPVAAKLLWQANIDNFPDNADAYFQFANGLSTLGEYKKAERLLQKAIALVKTSGDQRHLKRYKSKLDEISDKV